VRFETPNLRKIPIQVFLMCFGEVNSYAISLFSLALHTRLTTCFSRKLRFRLSAVFRCSFGLQQSEQILFPPPTLELFSASEAIANVVNGIISIGFTKIRPIVTYRSET